MVFVLYFLSSESSVYLVRPVTHEHALFQIDSAEDVSKRPRQDVVDRNDSEPLKCSCGYSLLYNLQLQLYFVEQKKRGYQYPQIFNVKLLSGASVLEIALRT